MSKALALVQSLHCSFRVFCDWSDGTTTLGSSLFIVTWRRKWLYYRSFFSIIIIFTIGMKAALSIASERFTWRYTCNWVSQVGGWMETWKDRAALMWSMWNSKLNPNNPGVNPTWIRSNRLRHERTTHPSWAKCSCNINRRMFSYHIEPLSLFSHQSPWSHGQQVSPWKTGWGQQVNMGLWFTWEIPEAEREQRSVTSWL